MTRPLDFSSPLALLRTVIDKLTSGTDMATNDDDSDRIIIDLVVIDLDTVADLLEELEVHPRDDHRIDRDGWVYVRPEGAPWVPIGNVAEDVSNEELDDAITDWKRSHR